MKKVMLWKTKGMNQDISPSAFNPEFSFENYNMRLTTNDGNTGLSWVNERGPLEVSDVAITRITNVGIMAEYYIQGITIGYATINHQLILFTTDNNGNDFIYRLTLNENNNSFSVRGKILFNGNLGFNTEHPIDTIVSYENENIQKIYWTDGYNQPRLINVAHLKNNNGEYDETEDNERIRNYTSTSFDFTPTLELKEDVKVRKILGSGEFPSGVIQYAFTYYNKNGQESAIFYTTPLQYISSLGRAGSPEEKVANSFEITITNPDTKFDYIRTYSIQRTSLNATPIAKRVRDVKINSSSTVNIIIGTPSNPITNATIQVSNPTLYEVDLEGVNVYHSLNSLTSLVINVENDYPHDPENPENPEADNTLWPSNFTPTTGYKINFNTYPNAVVRIKNSNVDYFISKKNTTSDNLYIGINNSNNYCICGSTLIEGHKEYSTFTQTSHGYTYTASGIRFTDDGTMGNTIDPTELLYKGGENITVNTLEQKDNTLFLGGLSISRSHPDIQNALLEYTGASKASPTGSIDNRLTSVLTRRPFIFVGSQNLGHIDTLNVVSTENYQGIAGFKSNEYYRLGIQFQHQNGKWTEPYWVGDRQQTFSPESDESNNEWFATPNTAVIAVPEFKLNLSDFTLSGQTTSLFTQLRAAGYRKVRGVYSIPKPTDRTILCQGIGCSTLYTNNNRNNQNPYAQSSWLFRSYFANTTDYHSNITSGRVTYKGELVSQFHNEFLNVGAENQIDAPYFWSTEIMGYYKTDNRYRVDNNLITLHTPDVQFDNDGILYNTDFSGYSTYKVGYSVIGRTFGDIGIQLSSTSIGNGGVRIRSTDTYGFSALISGYFYEDNVVDDANNAFEPYQHESVPYNTVLWPVYMWHRNGSLNNDINRSGRTAVLSQKKISNYRRCNSNIFNTSTLIGSSDIALYSGSLVKVNNNTYIGDVNTMVIPEKFDDDSFYSPFYLSGNPASYDSPVTSDSYNSRPVFSLRVNGDSSVNGTWEFKTVDERLAWHNLNDDIGDAHHDLARDTEGVLIKYKSTPHIVTRLDSISEEGIFAGMTVDGSMPLIEIRKPYNASTIFGGTTNDAFKENAWIPCGPSVYFGDDSITSVRVDFKWGDTYFQRFECLKTYPYTTEDTNQVVEIGSFMCESRINIDGRYDRNRDSSSHLNTSPTNFNLLNPVYSQQDNFFSYKILDEDYYKVSNYPNQITWTLPKTLGADVDTWTNITLASILDLDGDKGEIRALKKFNNQVIAFQDTGISQILYNENVQIASTEGVPIEIANSNKVQGKRYISNNVGCSNKWSITESPAGLYFMDSINKAIFMYNGQINNLSIPNGFNTWAKKNIKYNPEAFNPESLSDFVSYYDKLNQEVLFIDHDNCLAYSEKLGVFTSFYSYNNTPFFVGLDDYGLWLNINSDNTNVWVHQKGEYGNFFNTQQPYYMTLISNAEPQIDKTFTNLEFRACVDNDADIPFDTLETWNEYQHGIAHISQRNGYNIYHHHTEDNNAHLARKFRIWRCDIPRDNHDIVSNEASRGIYRTSKHPMDRMRNPWIYLKLFKNNNTDNRVEVHDLVMTYFN